ncbi:hypothetical protein ABTO92_19430, partial [Acinetobacter baumannii]
ASIVVLDTRTASLSHKPLGVPGDPQMPPVIQASSEISDVNAKDATAVLTAGDPNAGKMKLMPPMEVAPDTAVTSAGYPNSYAPN